MLNFTPLAIIEKMVKQETIILSLGGSVIHPDTGMDTKFLSEFNKLIREQVAEGRRFFIMIGGGHIGREYQYAAKNVIGGISAEDFDWLGIHGTRLNAQLIRTIFRDVAYPKVITKEIKEEEIDEKTKVFVGAASGKPGTTTDFDFVRLAEKFKPQKFISLLNVKQIYDKDPKLFPDARPVSAMSWSAYREMIGEWWTPERQLPFDPFAARLAQELGLRIIFVDGRNLKNLENVLEGRKFKGTVIE